MTAALILFTLLWVISCYTIYRLMLKKLEQAEQLYEEGRQYNQRAADLFQAASEASQEALQARLASLHKLEQIQKSLTSLN